MEGGGCLWKGAGRLGGSEDGYRVGGECMRECWGVCAVWEWLCRCGGLCVTTCVCVYICKRARARVCVCVCVWTNRQTDRQTDRQIDKWIDRWIHTHTHTHTHTPHTHTRCGHRHHWNTKCGIAAQHSSQFNTPPVVEAECVLLPCRFLSPVCVCVCVFVCVSVCLPACL